MVKLSSFLCCPAGAPINRWLICGVVKGVSSSVEDRTSFVGKIGAVTST